MAESIKVSSLITHRDTAGATIRFRFDTLLGGKSYPVPVDLVFRQTPERRVAANDITQISLYTGGYLQRMLLQMLDASPSATSNEVTELALVLNAEFPQWALKDVLFFGTALHLLTAGEVLGLIRNPPRVEESVVKETKPKRAYRRDNDKQG